MKERRSGEARFWRLRRHDGASRSQAAQIGQPKAATEIVHDRVVKSNARSPSD
jgi:hypothetical protein